MAALLATSVLRIDAGPVHTYELYPSVVLPRTITLALALERREDGSREPFWGRPIDAESLAKWQLRPGGPSLEMADARIRAGMSQYPGRRFVLTHRTIERGPDGVRVRDEDVFGSNL